THDAVAEHGGPVSQSTAPDVERASPSPDAGEIASAASDIGPAPAGGSEADGSSADDAGVAKRPPARDETNRTTEESTPAASTTAPAAATTPATARPSTSTSSPKSLTRLVPRQSRRCPPRRRTG